MNKSGIGVGDRCFVRVKYDNPAASDDNSGFHDINAMVATMILSSTHR
jgi:hypothetical protein